MLSSATDDGSDVKSASDAMEELNVWMQRTNLPKKVKEKFVEEEVTLDVLLISSENDLRLLCKEFNFNRLSTMKLLAAVKKIPDAKINKKSKIIIMDFQEKDAITKTEQALGILQNALLISQNGVKTLVENAVKTEEQVRNAFIELNKKINEREKELFARLDVVRVQQTEDLKNDVTRFEKYIIKVKKAIKEQNELFDLSLTSDARKQRVLDIKANAIEDNFNYELTENENLVYKNLFGDDLFQFITDYGFIDGCFKVRLPLITSASIVQRNNISLEWSMTECDAKVDYYEIQHTNKRYPDTNDWIIAKHEPSNCNSLNFVIKRLKYSNEYFVRVRGSNSYGYGPFSETKIMETLPQPIPNEPIWYENYPQLDGNLNIKLQWKITFEDIKDDDEVNVEEEKESKEDDEQPPNATVVKQKKKRKRKSSVTIASTIEANVDEKQKKRNRYSDDDEIVQFELQYANDGNEWESVFIDRLVDSVNQVCEYRLERLNEKSVYDLRLRSKNRVDEWSAWSVKSTVQTLAGIQKHCVIWNEINAAPPAPVHIQNGGKRISAPDASCWETFVGSNVGLSEGKHTWKIKWTKFGGSYQAVAIVSNVQCVHTKQMNHRFNNDNTPYGDAYFWHRDHKKIAHAKGGTETDLESNLSQWEVGDIVTIFLDLTANKIQFEHNSTVVGTYDIKPDMTWYPLVLLCTCGNECESVPVSEW